MSKIEVNTVAPQCGTTLTLGESGDTVTLGSGASQSGFGRTGTVDWQTSIKTGDFTATSGEGYFVNTTSGAITVTLPASPSAGDIVSIKDYAQTFDTNACTVGRNSQPIEGQTFDLILGVEGTAVTLIYGDATKGWQSVNSNEITNSIKFITATGGTITTSGNFKIHTFTGPGTFTVQCAGNSAGSNSVDYLVVAGGGAGANAKDGTNGQGGGGGAGGYRESGGTASGCYTVSPLGSSPSPVAALPVTATSFPITVGAGGAGSSSDDAPPCGTGFGNIGSNSVFSSITSAGGGGGGRGVASNGGSGGGAACGPVAGNGNTPPVTPPQGNPGGTVAGSGNTMVAGGGGGATAAGAAGNSGGPAGNGGAGATSSINTTPTTRAGGGGGGGNSGQTGGGSGGSGGGGAGGTYNGGSGPGVNGTAATANTGGGGGASASANGATPITSGSGGSGIVIIRYKFQ